MFHYETDSDNKILFNFDFPWNVHERGFWRKRDWGTPKRIINYSYSKDLGKKFLENILYFNAKRFFNV